MCVFTGFPNPFVVGGHHQASSRLQTHYTIMVLGQIQTNERTNERTHEVKISQTDPNNIIRLRRNYPKTQTECQYSEKEPNILLLQFVMPAATTTAAPKYESGTSRTITPARIDTWCDRRNFRTKYVQRTPSHAIQAGSH